MFPMEKALSTFTTSKKCSGDLGESILLGNCSDITNISYITSDILVFVYGRSVSTITKFC